MNTLSNLPVGDASFESIRHNQFLYVDKTRHIYQMVSQGKYYFLSRPRRFGKSLTVSTLRGLFLGQRELFAGLWIEQHTDWEWQEHPVIMLDFNGITHDTPETLKQGLSSRLRHTARLYDVELHEMLLKELFRELILELHIKTSMPVVILIDEYDKPLIDHLGRGEAEMAVARNNRDELKQFFGVIKDGDVARVLRFVFITGVSKFSRVSIFSELNNLEDITMVEEYADMLGYTQTEMESYFEPYIQLMAEKRGSTASEILKQLRLYYDGYRFSKHDLRVYNPFSVLTALKQKDFKNYWFESGTPTFLINLLHERNWYLPTIENMETSEDFFNVFELEYLQPEAVLFQTGYVTIKDVQGELYTFDYPNQEVKTAFLRRLFHSYTQGLSEASRFMQMQRYLLTEDLPAFMETITAIFKDIPYTLEIKRDEAFFHTLFYLMVSASGVDARSEVLTCDGRIDLLMHVGDNIYIIEFKCNQCADVALQQIKEKGYAQAYLQRGKKLILIGINFDREQRNVAEWRVESG